RDSIAATIHPGGQRAALLHALGANDTHGHRRTDMDRRHAIELMLADPEWQAWSNREIARQCRVSEFLVRTVRQELAPPQETEAPPEQTRKVTRGGKQFTMRTERIGTAARTRAQASASSGSALSPAPTASVAPSENGGADTADAAAPTSAIQSQTGTPQVGLSPSHPEQPPPLPVAPAETQDGVPSAPPPSLMDAWQQASDDERTAFVARYRDDLRLLLTVLDEQPQKRASASQRTPRPQPQQKPRRRAAARKR